MNYLNNNKIKQLQINNQKNLLKKNKFIIVKRIKIIYKDNSGLKITFILGKILKFNWNNVWIKLNNWIRIQNIYKKNHNY